MFCEKIRIKQSLSYISFCSLKIPNNTKYHFNGNIFRNKCCYYNRHCNVYETVHDKPAKWHVRPAKTQISLGICPVWSESLLSTWRKLGSLATQWVHSKDSDQIGRMPSLIRVFAGCTCRFVALVMRWLMYIYMSCKMRKCTIRHMHPTNVSMQSGQSTLSTLRVAKDITGRQWKLSDQTTDAGTDPSFH